ncbi:putative pentatricopeptide repeat-containing protein [Senna tora]|uniref:Putative pentatricopeptide repeat-containing protein n=1 Tax=Senna tora TaxID=362788 RepID=A0A834WPB3_9FABA|nr:putative pentatricopeptide repeat-containing protein [Senna tora]
MRRLLCNGAIKCKPSENHSPSLPLGYCNSGISYPIKHFSSTPTPSPWSYLINALAKGETNAELSLFEASRLFSSGTKPNAYAMVHLLRATTNLGWDPLGLQLHSYALRSGYYSDTYVSAALIRFYVGMHSLSDAHKLFDEIPQLNVVSWNTLISGSVVVSNCLIDMYGKCGCVEEAVRVFSEIIDKDTISWNSVIAASANNAKFDQAFHFLRLMPNPNTISYNGLINGIAQVGSIGDAIQVLSTMPNPNSSSWNSIITGYVNRNQAPEALEMFNKMHSRNIQMDEFTFSIILNGIACLSALTWGMLIHCCTIKYGLDTSLVVGSALIDMYSKCGKVKNAESIFHSLPSRNLVSWNAVISGYARNGDSAKVIHLYELLKRERHIKPDGITFLNLLFACSHNHIPFEVVVQYFNSMISDYGITPTIEHCCSVIRLMGQKGELWRAERMIHELGFQSCGLVWRALLGACEANRDLQVAEIAAAMLMDLEGNEDYVYVMMSNLYASYGSFDHQQQRAPPALLRVKQISHDHMKTYVGAGHLGTERPSSKETNTTKSQSARSLHMVPQK